MKMAYVKKEVIKMPRPRKCRWVCRMPENRGFVPVGGAGDLTVVMTVDEYETIRLIDREGFSQEQCGEQMKIARTTVQQIYTSARKKLADALVEGAALKIEGGDYRICESDSGCGHCCCRGHRHGRMMNKEEEK